MLRMLPDNPSSTMLRASLVAVETHPEVDTLSVWRLMPFRQRSIERADRRLEIRLTVAERRQLDRDADEAGLSVSELVRRRALGRIVQAASDLTTIRELRRLGGLQKHTMNKLLDRSDVTSECIATIRALREAIERLAR